MAQNELLIDAQRLWSGETAPDVPMGFVDLDAGGDVPDVIALPPFPVIGLGDSAHPLAASLDAVVEPPVDADALAAQICAMPRAAAVIVQLLRLLPSLEPVAALTAESFAYAVLQGSDEHRGWIGCQQHTPSGQRSEGHIDLARDGERLTITLDRPDEGNAIDRAMRDALYDAFALAALDPAITRVSLRAKGKAFSLGAALHEFGTISDPATAHAIRCRTLPAWQAAACADRLDVHVQGGCVGSGLELAAWGRRITASPRAWFHLPELAMGILPGAGGCVSLSRRIGRQRAALMILSGKRLNAKQALAWGLVDGIVDTPS